MNSLRIRELFGSYVVDVLQQSADHRIASLCSVHDGQHICRTLAVTLFVTPTPPALAEADSLIRAGASIGETLERMGIDTQKTDDHWCTWAAGEHFSSLTGGEVPKDTELGVRLYTLRATVAGATHEYAVIAEAYHPAHIPLDPHFNRCGNDEPDGKHLAALQWLRSALSDPVEGFRQSAAQQG